MFAKTRSLLQTKRTPQRRNSSEVNPRQARHQTTAGSGARAASRSLRTTVNGKSTGKTADHSA